MAMASAANDQATVTRLVVSTSPNAASASTEPSASASFTDTLPAVTGRCAVRFTCRSNSRSAVAGVAALLTAYPDAFSAVQWLGAAYLAWLGTKMLLAKPGAAPVLNIKPSHYLKQALMITLLNPKAILFYMAFFPLFVDPVRQQGLATYAFMAATIAALTFGYGLTSTLLTHFFAQKIRANPMISRVLEKVAGLFLVGFGIKLAVSR